RARIFAGLEKDPRPSADKGLLLGMEIAFQVFREFARRNDYARFHAVEFGMNLGAFEQSLMRCDEREFRPVRAVISDKEGVALKWIQLPRGAQHDEFEGDAFLIGYDGANGPE